VKILSVVGARPNFMKIAPICRALDAAKEQYPDKKVRNILVHTGQHYDENMSKVFFDDLEIPRPDVNLEVGSGSHAQQTAGVMVRFEKLCVHEKPDLVIVVGDVNSTLACSVVASKLWIPVAHVEAGLRSFDRRMPEEINRVVTDALSEYLFTTCREADDNLKREGISPEKIHFVGNVMIDSLYHSLPKAKESTIKRDMGLGADPYALVTLHRPSNVDDDKTFERILGGLVNVSEKMTVVFPVHPRTGKKIEYTDAAERIKAHKGLRIVDPVGYHDFLALMKDAAVLLTDSGGIQEETTVLSVPCLTLRENTERPVTISEGTNELVGTDMEKLTAEVDRILNGNAKKGNIPELWDGKAAERIVANILGLEL